MQTDCIPLLEPTPVFHSSKCKAIAFLIRVLLQFTTPVSALIVWYFYDYFIAITTLLLSFILMGIVRSKLRNSSVPPKQREYHYNDKGIADWYTKREFCFSEKDSK